MLAGTSSSTPPLSSTCRFTLLLLQLCGLAQAQDRCRPGQCRAKGCFLSCPDCHACSAGYRCPATGGGDKSICYTEGRFPCPAGTHAPTGSASCPICPANTWSPATASGCTACPAGRFSPRQSTSVAACVDPCSIFCETCASSECQRVVTLVQDSCDPVFRKDGFLRQAFYPELATAVSTCDNAAKSSHHVVRTVHCHCICHVISLFRGH